MVSAILIVKNPGSNNWEGMGTHEFAVLPLPFTGIVLAIAVVWLGFALITGREASTEQLSRVS